MDEADIERLLQSALVCAILGKAGPQRSRMLGTLYKDERTRALEHFGVLEKMCALAPRAGTLARCRALIGSRAAGTWSACFAGQRLQSLRARCSRTRRRCVRRPVAGSSRCAVS